MEPSLERRGNIEVVDVHVGGDVHRIIMDGIRPLPGSTVLEQMHYLRDNADGLRQLMLNEPRGGHPSLFADLVVQPCHPDADAGYIIMETMGYPHISGTNTMSTVIALLETGRLPMRNGECMVKLEAPGGLIEVKAKCLNGKVLSVTYEAQAPSFVYRRDLNVEVPGWGNVTFDIVWTGAFYPIIDAVSLGFEMKREDEEKLVAFSKAFIVEARKLPSPIHPIHGDEGPLAFVVFSGRPEKDEQSKVLKVACYVYPDAHICRSPAGVPTTAAAVRLLDQGKLEVGEPLRSVSIFDTDLLATLTEKFEYHGSCGARARVTGSGWIIMKSQVIVDPSDPLTPRDGLFETLK